MKNNYELISLETHLFFGRIMKEHALFLTAGFPCKNTEYTKQANWYRVQFEELLRESVKLSRAGIREDVLRSNEIVTQYTLAAEKKTSFLTGIAIDSQITEAEMALRASCDRMNNPKREQIVRKLNKRALWLLDGLIAFKEKILRDVAVCRLFTFNYPLLIEHILREARLYRCLIAELESRGTIEEQNMQNMEPFWNQIMMEHALFIRGLLDPTEEELIETANEFAHEYRKLLDEAIRRDCQASKALTRETIQETIRYRDFKEAGTKGITKCQISGLILPLLADHVLREANHYLRILESSCD